MEIMSVGKIAFNGKYLCSCFAFHKNKNTKTDTNTLLYADFLTLLFGQWNY